MKKFLLTALMIGMVSSASAQEVVVEGMGVDRESASRDAMRVAVEQVAGAYISAETIVQDLIVGLDEIVKKSAGYVKSFNIIDERSAAGNYTVRARVDVDTNPDGKFMSDLAMLFNLNDPRIAVIVVQQNNSFEHTKSVEDTMNAALLSMGFNHIVDAQQVIRLNNARLLNDVYNGSAQLNDFVQKDNAVDYLVLGQSNVYDEPIKIPDYKNSNGGNALSTDMNGARASLSVKILKYDTGDLIGSFQAEGSGLNGNQQRASDLAMQSAAKDAAKQLERILKQFGSKINSGIQLIVNANNFELVEQLRRDLLNVSGVDNAFIRSHDGNKAVLEIQASQKPHAIVQMLRQRTKLAFFVERVTNSTIQLNISQGG